MVGEGARRGRSRYDVAIVGAGITGTAAAYYLSQVGRRVVVLDRADIAGEGSGRTLGGVRQSARDAAELPLAMEAVRLWAGLAGELGRDVGYRQTGNLRLGTTKAEVAHLEEIVATGRSAGLDIELVEGERLRRLAPALSPAVIAASYCASDGYVLDPPLVARSYAQVARGQGATFLTGTGVVGVEMTGGRVSGVVTPDGLIGAPVVVLCTGVGTGALCRELGLQFPMQARRVQIAVLRTDQPRFTAAFGMADAGMSGCPDALDGHFRFASSAHGEIVDPQSVNDLPTLPEVEAQLLDRAGAIFTNLGERSVVRRWSGLIDTTPDHKPVLDALSSPSGLVLAAGFSGHGFCLGPISGRLIADIILDGRPSLSLHAFRWSRFPTS